MTEYYVHIWGGALEQAQAALNIPTTDFYFPSREERDGFIERAKALGFGSRLCYWTIEGELTHKRTVAHVTFEYKGETYLIKRDFGYEYPADATTYYFEGGNGACDCNRSLLIADQCDSNFPELECDKTIKMVSLEVVLEE